MTTTKDKTTAKNIDTYLLRLYVQKYDSVVQMLEEYERNIANAEVFTHVKIEIYKGLLKSKKRLYRNIKSLTK